MKPTRRTVTAALAGACGAALLASAANAFVRGGVAGGGGGGGVTLPFTATLNNPDALPSPVNDMKTIGVPIARGDVPSGFTITPTITVNGVTTTISNYQFDLRANCDDGSLGMSEMNFLVPVAIPAGGKGTINFIKQSGAFNNTLPNSLTKANVIANVAADPTLALAMQLSGMTSCTGQAPQTTTIGSGAWAQDVNTALANGVVTFTHSGPVCCGFRAYMPFQDTVGGTNHDSLRADWYVKFWFDPSNPGSILDVEYVLHVRNGETTATHPVDRYNYVASLTRDGVAEPNQPVLPVATIPAVTSITVSGTVATVNCSAAHNLTVNQLVNINGATPTVWNNQFDYAVKTVPDSKTFTITGVSSTPPTGYFLASAGGHNARSSWSTRLSTGLSRFAKTTASKLWRSMGASTRSYITNAGYLPPFNSALTPSTVAAGLTYSPLAKAGLTGNSAHNFASLIAIDSGGDSVWIGMLPEIQSACALSETQGLYNDARVGAATWASINAQWVDTNGRIPNLIGGAANFYQGLNASQTGTFRIFNISGGGSSSGITLNAGNSWIENGCWTGTDGDPSKRQTTHWPTLPYFTYLLEGGYDHLYNMLLDAGFVLMQCGLAQRNPTSPVSTTGVILGGTIEREDAWGWKEMIWAYGVAPNFQADGTTAFGEKAYFRDCLTNSLSWAAALITGSFSTAEKTLGTWYHNENGNGSDDPWMMSYFVSIMGMTYKKFGGTGEPFATNLLTMVNQIKNYFIGFWTINPAPAWLKSIQCIEIKSSLSPDIFVTDWTQVGFHGYGNPNDTFVATATLADGATGWFYGFGAGATPITITSLTSSGTVATVQTASAHGLVTGGHTMAMGAAPDGYNGYVQVTVIDTTHFTYNLASSLSSPAAASLTSMAICNQLVQLPFWYNAPGVTTQVGPFVGDRVRIAVDLETVKSAVPPAGLALNTDYYIIAVDQVNFRIKLSATSGGAPLTFSADARTSPGLILMWMNLAGTLPGGYQGFNTSGSNANDNQAAIRALRFAGLADAGLVSADTIVTNQIATGIAISPSATIRRNFMVSP